MPSSLEAQFKEAMKSKQREILLAHIRDNPSLTIGELIGLKGEFGDVLKSLTVGEMLSGRSDGGGRRKRGGGGGRPDVADTRTKAARMAYDESMYESLAAAGKAMSAVELRGINGGTPDQARKALNRLIEGGRITFSGKARGTRYKNL
jgi:hypothetical protein